MDKIDKLQQLATKARRLVLKVNHHAGQGHTGADLSEIDILTVLYGHIMDINPGDDKDNARDRFILSKGHGVGGLYACLCAQDLLDAEEFKQDYLGFETAFPGHPVAQKTKFIELNTGALGHGLPVAVGMALSAKRLNKRHRIFVLSGDGELQEGSNWEASMVAKTQNLGNLVWIIDRNYLQLAGDTEVISTIDPLDKKLQAFNYDVHQVDGHDIGALISIFESLDYQNDQPKAIIAHTIKGAGVSFIKNNAAWHHKVPSKMELQQALEELKL